MNDKKYLYILINRRTHACLPDMMNEPVGDFQQSEILFLSQFVCIQQKYRWVREYLEGDFPIPNFEEFLNRIHDEGQFKRIVNAVRLEALRVSVTRTS